MGSEGDSRITGQKAIADLLATARAGGGLPTDSRELDNALSAVSKPSEQLFSSFSDYARDFYKTANDISDLNFFTEKGLTEQQAMQATLEAQLGISKASFDSQISQIDATQAAAQAQLDAFLGNTTAIMSLTSALALFASTLATAATVKATQNAGVGVLSASERDATLQYASAKAAQNGTNYELELYQLAKSKGYTAANVDQALGLAPGAAAGYISRAGLPMLETGTNYVPQDGAYYLHQGEAVQPRQYNPAAGNGGMNTERLESLVQDLLAEVALLRASGDKTEKNTSGTESVLRRTSRDGTSFATSPA